MFTHKYEGDGKDGIYHRRKELTGFNKAPVIVIFLIMALLIGLQRISLSSGHTESWHENNYKLWNKYKDEKLAEIELLKNTSAKLLMRYENLQCSTRGLTVTTVKGITLCMNPETKALHKIDEEAN